MKTTEEINLTWEEAARLNTRIWKQDGGKMNEKGLAESDKFKVEEAYQKEDGTWYLRYHHKDNNIKER